MTPSSLMQLLYMGRDYPLGYHYFRTRAMAAFRRHRDEKDPEQIQQLIDRGWYVVREIEALYKLKKYRTLKRRYYN